MSGDPPGTREPRGPGPAEPPYAFVAGALDRADALRDDPAALDALWPGGGVVEVDGNGRVEVSGDAPHWRRGGALQSARPDDSVFLGLDRDGRGWFARARAPIADESGGARHRRARIRHRPAHRGRRLAGVRRHRVRAGARGAALAGAAPPLRRLRRAAGVRARRLARALRGCGLDHYPRTDPAVIVAVDDGERLLLGRQRGWAPGRWSVIAGFVEPGESLEQTVAREVHEETAVRVRDCRYIASQPWPFPSALMLGFVARAEPQVPVAGEELEAVRWFDADAVRAGLARDWNAPQATAPQPQAGAGQGAAQPSAEDAIVLSPRLSIARWLIESWLAAHDSRSDTRNP
jgi:NAD+ diphosphatase